MDVPWVFLFNGGYKFASNAYGYVDPSIARTVSFTHLSDVVTALFGAQFLVRANDPGYFVAFSYDYSSLFRDADTQIGPPARLFGILWRLEMRRPFVTAHLGIHPSLTYEMDTRLKTVETSMYWWFTPGGRSHIRNSAKLNAGFRVGYEEGRGGVFASVFIEPTFGTIP